MPPIAEGRFPATPICTGIVAAAVMVSPVFVLPVLILPVLTDSEKVPAFMPDARTGWGSSVPGSDTPIGDDFILPKSGPGPVTCGRTHPFLDNRQASQLGRSSTNRVADLTNPILLPRVREELRQINKCALLEIQLWTAENNPDVFNQDIMPIPTADKPDF
jgi:hypothetical protein